jgi:hypothetical protein
MSLLVALSFAIVFSIVLVRRQQRFDARPIVILGTGPMTSKLVEEVECSNDGCCLAGLVDHHRPTDNPLRSIPWLGSFDKLSEIVDDVRPWRIIVALADRRGRLPLESLLESRIKGVIVEDALEFYERLTGKIAIEELTPGTLIMSKGFRHDGCGQAVARAMNLTIALIGLIVCAPAATARRSTFSSSEPCIPQAPRSRHRSGCRTTSAASRESGSGCAASVSTRCRRW